MSHRDDGPPIPGTISRTALRLREDLSFQEWAEAGDFLRDWHDKLPYLIGDWLIYGQEKFGEASYQAVTGYSPETARGWQYVCERIPPDRRRETLKFAHHRAVASLTPDEQDKFLDLAEKHTWNRTTLRDAVQAYKIQKAAIEKGEPQDDGPRPPPSVSLVKAGATGREAEFTEINEQDQDISASTDVILPPAINEPVQQIIEPEHNQEPINFRDTDEAAAYLGSVAKTTLNKSLSRPILTIIDERKQLRRIAQLAVVAIEIGSITPELEAAAHNIRIR